MKLSCRLLPGYRGSAVSFSEACFAPPSGCPWMDTLGLREAGQRSAMYPDAERGESRGGSCASMRSAPFAHPCASQKPRPCLFGSGLGDTTLVTGHSRTSCAPRHLCIPAHQESDGSFLSGEEVDWLGYRNRAHVAGFEAEEFHAGHELALELGIFELARHDLASRDFALGRDGEFENELALKIRLVPQSARIDGVDRALVPIEHQRNFLFAARGLASACTLHAIATLRCEHRGRNLRRRMPGEGSCTAAIAPTQAGGVD